MNLKLPSHINHHFSPNHYQGIEGKGLLNGKNLYQNNSIKNSKKQLLQSHRFTHYYQNDHHLTVLGRTKLSPTHQSQEIKNDNQIIKNKLVQLNSLPFKVMKRIRNEEQKIYEQSMDTNNENQSSSIIGVNGFNKIENFKKLKDQFWQQSKRTQSNTNQTNINGPALSTTIHHQDSSLMSNNGNVHNPSYTLYNKINAGGNTNGIIKGLQENGAVQEGRVIHGLGHNIKSNQPFSVKTSRSNSPSPMKSSRVTKLVYKIPQNETNYQARQSSLKLPDLQNFGQSSYNPIANQNFRQSNASPQLSQFGGINGSTFLTSAVNPSFDTTQEEGSSYSRRKVQIKETKAPSKSKFIHSIETGNQSHISGYQEQLLDRQSKINAAISNQIENFENVTSSTAGHGLQSFRFSVDNTITQNGNKNSMININELNSIQEIEHKLLTDIQNCKVCQQKYNKMQMKNFDEKQAKQELYSLKQSDKKKSNNFQMNSPSPGEGNNQQFANTSEYFNFKQNPNQMSNTVTPKNNVNIINQKFNQTQNKNSTTIDHDQLISSRMSSLPKISDKRGSNGSLFAAMNSVHQSRDFSTNNRKFLNKDSNTAISKPFSLNFGKEQAHPGYLEYLKSHHHNHHQNNHSDGESEDDGDKYMNELAQDDQQIASSFLKNQEQRIEFRQKVKDQFEKGDLDQDEFEQLVLLNIRKSQMLQQKQAEPIPQQSQEPALSKKSTIAFGGLGLKFREKIMKESENVNNGKFYDFLMTLRDRENLLSQSMRDIQKPKYQEQTKEMVLEYLKECEKQRAVPLAQAVTQIRNQEYSLSDYQLNSGIVKALCQSINLSRDKLTKISLSHNQISDDQFSQILNSLNENQLNSLKSIIYCTKNEFGPKSFEVLKDKYLSKVPPFQLEELRIAGCKVIPGSVNNILEVLKETCFLKKLSMPKTKLNEYSVDLLVQLISKQSAPNLIELDISWNELCAHSMTSIIKALSLNDRLQVLNLSWNEIREDVDIKPLGQFIRNNPNLIHLDLSKMFSSQQHIKYLIKSIRKAHSLQSVHLSNTPLIRKSKKLYNYILRKLQCTGERLDRQLVKKPNVHQLYKNEWKEQIKTQFMRNQAEKELHEYTCYNINTAANQGRASTTIGGDVENFILSRILEHPEMPGSAQWTVSQECFICGRWQYTIFMKLHERQDQNQSNPLAGMFGGRSLMQKKPQIQQETLICDQNVQIKFKGSHESIMNYKTNQMINILKFAQILDPSYITPEQKYEKLLNTLDQTTFNQIQKNQTLKDQKLYEVKKEIEEHYKQNWKQIVKKAMRFKNIQFIPETLNFDKADENLYVFADIVKASCQLEQINILTTGQSQQNAQQTQILYFPQIRKEELQPLPFKKREAQFEDKNVNVFAEWKVDTDAILDEVIENDFKYWKVNKFVKDSKDLEEIEETFRENIRPLKNIYLTMISLSNYPNLTWLDFVNFIKQCNIIDERTQIATIDRMFIAANVEVTDIEENPDRALCRYELWEILVRIAGQKFKETNLAQTFNESLEKLLENNILKYSLALPWQEFRDEELWVKDVNLVFDANMDALQKLYKKHFQPKQSWMSLQDAVTLMSSKEVGVELSYKDSTFAYGMSKMTVKNEMEKGANPYKKLLFVEFLEFIGRSAALKYRRSSEPLYLKIEKILDLILPVVGMSRRDFVRKVEIPNVESDESVLDEHLEDQEAEGLMHQQSEEQYMQYFSVLKNGKSGSAITVNLPGQSRMDNIMSQPSEN
eukprot:403344534